MITKNLDILFKALSDPARLRIIQLLNRSDEECCTDEDRVCACDLEIATGLSQPTTSHHLKILVQAGLVEAEKEGRFTYYRINRTLFNHLAEFLESFNGKPSLGRKLKVKGEKAYVQ